MKYETKRALLYGALSILSPDKATQDLSADRGARPEHYNLSRLEKVTLMTGTGLHFLITSPYQLYKLGKGIINSKNRD